MRRRWWRQIRSIQPSDWLIELRTAPCDFDKVCLGGGVTVYKNVCVCEEQNGVCCFLFFFFFLFFNSYPLFKVCLSTLKTCIFFSILLSNFRTLLEMNWWDNHIRSSFIRWQMITWLSFWHLHYFLDTLLQNFIAWMWRLLLLLD